MRFPTQAKPVARQQSPTRADAGLSSLPDVAPGYVVPWSMPLRGGITVLPTP